MRRPAGSALLAIACGAGLVTGLSRFPDWWIVPVAAMVAAWLLRQEWWAVALPVFALGGVWGNQSAVMASQSCAATLPLGNRQLVIHTVEPGSGTGRVRLTGCPGVLTAQWPRFADIPAGVSVTVSARWRPQPGLLDHPGGLLTITRVGTPHGAPGPIDRLRTAIARATDTLYGSRAPLVDAFITGRRGELDPALRQAFSAAGLIHLLSISGFHIGLLAGWVLLLLRLLRVPRHPAEALAALAAVGYAAFLGMPPPATRAAGLIALVAFCRWRQRNVSPDALLGASALVVLLVDPWSVVSVGGWLSVCAVGGMVLATRWSDRAIGTRPLVRSLSGSIGATLGTAPIAALVFGRVALVGILLNLVAIPLTALAVPTLLASLLVFPVAPVLASSCATSGSLLLAALEAIARTGARAPAFGEAGAGSTAAAIPWLAIALLAWWATHDRSTVAEASRRSVWALTVAAWGLLLWPGGSAATIRDGELTLLFADVGQGDAALIRTPGGHWIEVDAGPLGEGFDAGKRVLVPLLHRYHVARLDAFVLSHAHRDHVGGAGSVLSEIPVGVAIEPGELFDESSYQDWLAELSAKRTRWQPASTGLEWQIDGVTFRVRHPPVVWPHRGEDLNEDSIVLEVRYGNFAALLMGDAGFVTEAALAPTLGHVDLLKVGHHGSRGASGEAFLAQLHPEAAVISVGRNRYGHPAPETLARLQSVAVRTWRTDREGTTTVVTDGQRFTVVGGRTAATFEASATHSPGR